MVVGSQVKTIDTRISMQELQELKNKKGENYMLVWLNSICHNEKMEIKQGGNKENACL